MRPIVAIEQQFVNDLANLYDTNEVKHIYFLLLEHRKGWTKTDYLLYRNDALNEEDSAWLAAALQALKVAKPIQHILGHTWFMGMKLSVNDSVLIPRPETEELVDLIIREHRLDQQKPLHIIDIGTGSGAIAIALKKAFPSAIVYALDISKEALHVAKQNASNQSVDLAFINADILEWDSFFQPGQTFDIIVSNPPYITVDEQRNMHRNVLAYEPHLALFVAESAPLLFYEHIATFALEHLHTAGSLYFEINRRFGQEVCGLLRKKTFGEVRLHQDIQGADRIIHAKKKNN